MSNPVTASEARANLYRLIDETSRPKSLTAYPYLIAVITHVPCQRLKSLTP